MAATKMYAVGELDDGTVWADIRVTLADKMAFEKTSHAQGWGPIEGNPVRFSAFLSWHAARRTGKIPTDMTWLAFLDHVVDATVTADDGGPIHSGYAEGDEDPTRPAPSTM